MQAGIGKAGERRAAARVSSLRSERKAAGQGGGRDEGAMGEGERKDLFALAPIQKTSFGFFTLLWDVPVHGPCRRSYVPVTHRLLHLGHMLHYLFVRCQHHCCQLSLGGSLFQICSRRLQSRSRTSLLHRPDLVIRLASFLHLPSQVTPFTYLHLQSPSIVCTSRYQKIQIHVNLDLKQVSNTLASISLIEYFDK